MHLANHVKIFYTGIVSANRYYLFSKDALRWTLLPNPGHEYFLHSILLNSQMNFVDCQIGKDKKEKETCLQMTFIVVAVVRPLSHVQLFVTPWTVACQASLSFTIPRSLLKLMSIESMMPSNHLIFCNSLLHLPSIFPSYRVVSNKLTLPIRWPKYWSFGFSISPFN